MNQRERILTVVTLVLGIIFLAWFTVNAAQRQMAQLRAEVDRLQEQVVTASYQISRKQQVEAEYARVAAQHSSEWDKYEVYERLRQEIFRLAQRVPQPLDESGVPVKATNESGQLVNIPELRQGVMTESGEGYREYKISFRIPSVEINDLFNFLERLRQSPQSLRIDGLTFSRDWDSTLVAADIELVRIIVNSHAVQREAAAEAAGGGFIRMSLEPGQWSAGRGKLQKGEGLSLHASEPDAELFLEQALPGQSSYDCVVEFTSTGGGILAVATADGKEAVPLEGAQELPGDGTRYRAHLRFTVPGERGQPVVLRAPYIRLNENGAQVQLHSVALRRAEG
jgi:HAMP domain-containing protein